MSPRIPQDSISEILNKVEIQKVASEYLKLIKTGRSYKALCPFHGEKTPSFHIDPQKGLFYCFGCHTGGTVVDLLMQLEGFTFPETIKHLAQKVGVTIPELNREESDAAQQKRSEKEAYIKILSRTTEIFEQELWSSKGAAAQKYLAERGISKETAQTFQLGFAPSSWDELLKMLERQDIPPRQAVWAGLAIQGEQKTYSRFRNRLMFPINTVWGDVIAFSGRTLDPTEKAKYINSPETDFYTKGEHLFGLRASKQQIKQQGAAILVEGNFDVVSLYQAGLQNVVAPMGTALTTNQVKLLLRYTDKVFLLYDGDAAGRKATYKSLGPLQEGGLRSFAVDLPDNTDPDLLIRKGGSQAVLELINKGVPLIQFTLDALIKPVIGRGIEARTNTMNRVNNVLKLVTDPDVQTHYFQESQRRLGVESRRVSGNQKSVPHQQPVEQPTPSINYSEVEQTLVQVMTEDPTMAESFLKEFSGILPHEEIGEFLQTLHEEYSKNPSGFEVAQLFSSDAGVPSHEQLLQIIMQPKPIKAEQRKQVLEDLKRELILDWANQEVRKVYQSLKVIDKDDEEVPLLLERRRELTSLIAEFKHN